MGGRVGVGCLSGRPLPQSLAPGTHQSLTLMSGRVVSISSSQYPSALRSTTWDLRQVLGVGGGWEGLGLTTRALEARTALAEQERSQGAVTWDSPHPKIPRPWILLIRSHEVFLDLVIGEFLPLVSREVLHLPLITPVHVQAPELKALWQESRVHMRGKPPAATFS